MTTNSLQDRPELGAVLTLTPHDLAVSGGSIARHSGLAVFLDRGLPGETLTCRITESKPRFAKAEVLETVTPSPDETPSFCAFAERCGGCAWTNLRYEAQLAWKERHVKETLRRIGKVPFAASPGEIVDVPAPEYLPITPSPRVTGYRNKMEFAFGFDNGQPALGLRERGSHAVVSVGECALCSLPVGGILAAARDWLRTTQLAPLDGKAGYLRFLVIRCPEYTPDGVPRCLVECITMPGNAEQARMVRELGRELLANAGVTGFIHSTRSTFGNVAYGDTVVHSAGDATVTEQFGPLRLEAPVQAFLQANTGAAALLYSHARRYAEQERTNVVWDMYCGVGGLALSLAGEGITVRGVENVREAVKFATRNAASAPGDVKFQRGNADTMKTMATHITPAPDLVVTDPPRAGMARELTETLLRMRPPRIITVSCDAASLARDIALLGTAYRLKSARAVDMFPHTPHVEVVALLELSSR